MDEFLFPVNSCVSHGAAAPCVIGRDDIRHIRRGVKYPATGVVVSDREG